MTSRKALFDAVRQAEVDAVRDALATTPELALAAEPDGQTALHRCARVLAPGGDPGEDAVAIAGLLLDAGAVVDAVRRVPDGRRTFEATPLWYAVEQGRNQGVVDLLLARGADPSRVLWSVCFNEDRVTAAKLLEAGLRLDTGEHDHALIGAIRARKRWAIGWLLDHGAPVDVTDELGRGPLHHAVEARLPMKELDRLLAAGADRAATDSGGKTAADLAREQGRTRVAAHLERP